MYLLPLLALVLPLSSSSMAQSDANATAAYTPSSGACPSGTELVRMAGVSNQTLSDNETAFIRSRRSQVLPAAWNSYLQNVQATKISLPDYVSSILNGSSGGPTLGIATSGGGYRAAIFGAGVLNALDGRNSSSRSSGTGGLLQAATYLAGLSGGSWLVTSLMQANFPTLPELVFGPVNDTSGGNDNTFGGWNAQVDLITPNNDPTKDLPFFVGLIAEIAGKFNAGFPVTIADIWARLLARHFVNGTSGNAFFSNTGTNHGAGITFSDIVNLPSFVNFEVPFPIVLSESVSPRGNKSTIMTAAGDVLPLTNVIYEFNPYEMGSFDPMLSAFTPTKFLGSTNTSVCVTGFDQASFIAGSSSELFNEFNITLPALLNSSIGPLFSLLNGSLSQSKGVELDLALYPNPFFGVANSTFIDADQEFLGLVDGGEDGEVVPFQPLLVKARGVDVILVIDSTSDVNNFAAGSAMVAAQNRTSYFPSAYTFPPVPTDTATFVNQNLTSRPTFFGCNSSAPTPLLVYIANGAPPPGQPAITNTSTTQMGYQPAQVQAMLDETFIVTTQGRPASAAQATDPEWPACLACAVVDRERARNGTTRSGVCDTCFTRYCWNGTVDASSGSGSSSDATTTITTITKFSMSIWVMSAAVIAAIHI